MTAERVFMTDVVAYDAVGPVMRSGDIADAVIDAVAEDNPERDVYVTRPRRLRPHPHAHGLPADPGQPERNLGRTTTWRCWRSRCRRLRAACRPATASTAGTTRPESGLVANPETLARRRNMTTSPSAPPALRSRRVKTWSSLRQPRAQTERVRDRDPRHEPHHRRDAAGDGTDVHGNRWLLEHRDGDRAEGRRLDAFRDPDQMTYRKYTQAMDEQETYVDGLLQHYGEVQHSDALSEPAALDLLAAAMTPARYLGHGLQMVVRLRPAARPLELPRAIAPRSRPPTSCGACSAWPTARDNSPMPTRIAASASPKRKCWEGDPDWQPTRRGDRTVCWSPSTGTRPSSA